MLLSEDQRSYTNGYLLVARILLDLQLYVPSVIRRLIRFRSIGSSLDLMISMNIPLNAAKNH